MMSFHAHRLIALSSAVLLAACAGSSQIAAPRGIPSEQLPIDLERFMGDWYVVAHIPTSAEDEAYEAIESYALRDDGDIDVSFRFCEGSFDGPAREISMRGWVHDPTTNADWRVRPFWPVSLRYQILELDPRFTVTVVVHPSGRYAWIMSRQPRLSEAYLEESTHRLANLGFDTDRMRRVPHGDGSCLSEDRARGDRTDSFARWRAFGAREWEWNRLPSS
jgi:apolipoprotein D and lipocalin family protein